MFGIGPGFFKKLFATVTQSAATVDTVAVSACWSFRKLVPQYTGPCCTLSDGTSFTDIRFTANNEADFDAIAAALKAGQNQIVRLYDQGIYGLHLYQSNPSLRLAMVIDTSPGHFPGITFTGAAAAYYDAPANAAINNLFDASAGGGYLLFGGKLTSQGSGNGVVISKGQNTLALTAAGSTFTQGFTGANGVFNAALTLGNWDTYEIIYSNSGPSDVPLLSINSFSLATVATSPSGTRTDDSAYPLRVGADLNGNIGAGFTFLEMIAVKGIPS